MKNNVPTLSVCFFVIFLAFVSGNAQAASFKDTTTKTTSITESFTVSDMGCATDCKLVETALYRKKGVKKVVISGELVTVTYDTRFLKRDDIVKIIENTGSCEDPDAKIHKVKFKAS